MSNADVLVKNNRCSAEETAVCCCVDVGTVMDNSDCTASYHCIFDNCAEAEAMLKLLIEKARAVESAPCLIEHKLANMDGGVRLTIDFTFACQAEMIIFQLGLR